MSAHAPGDRFQRFRGRETDPYVDASMAARRAIELLLATAEGREVTRYVRTFLGVLHYTAFYSKLWDGVYLEQLVTTAGIAGEYVRGEFLGKHAADELRRLNDRGVIVYRPSRKFGEPSIVGLPGSEVAQLPLVTARGATKAISLNPLSVPEGEPLKRGRNSLSGSPSENFREVPSTTLSEEPEQDSSDPDGYFAQRLNEVRLLREAQELIDAGDARWVAQSEAGEAAA